MTGDPLDELYAVALDQFVSNRTRLERELRKAKQKEEADRVKALRKPTVSAWAVNQVARSEPALVADLLAAAANLRAAMLEALAGDRSGIHQAEDGHRKALRTVRSAARQAVESGGGSFSDAVDRRVTGILQAASVEAAVADELTAGRISSDLVPGGLGLDPATVLPSPIGVQGPVPVGTTGDDRPKDGRETARSPLGGLAEVGDEIGEEQSAELPQARYEDDQRRRQLHDEVERLMGRLRRLAAESNGLAVERMAAEEASQAADSVLAEAALNAAAQHRRLDDAVRRAEQARLEADGTEKDLGRARQALQSGDGAKI